MNAEFGMRKGETMIYECGVRNAEGGNNYERGQNVYRGPHGYLNIDNKTRFRCPDSYVIGLFSDNVSEGLIGIIRRSMSVQILRFIIRKSNSFCKFSQN